MRDLINTITAKDVLMWTVEVVVGVVSFGLVFFGVYLVTL